MSAILSFVRHHPLACFFTLAYALGWAFWPMSWVCPALSSEIDTRVVAWPFWPTARFCPALSGEINAFAPLVAALAVIAVTGGKSGLRAFFAAFHPKRAALDWYALAVLLPVTLTLLAVGLNLALGAAAPTAEQLGAWPGLALRFIAILLFISLGEEPGWRGFAVPRLQQGRSALSAGLVLGVIWGAWHAPLFGVEIETINVLPWAIGLVSASVLLVWIYNNTNGSILVPMLLHAVNNIVTGSYFWPMFTGADEQRLWWLQAAVWAAAVVVVVIAAGPARLARPAPAKGE